MERKTGVVVPLAALNTKDCPAVGEFTALKPFADFCKQAGLSVIQLLPVNDTGTQSSPYSGLSAFALHPLYLNISALPEFDDAMKSDHTFAGAYHTFEKEFKIPQKNDEAGESKKSGGKKNSADGITTFIQGERFDYDRILSEKIRILHLLYAWIEKQVYSESKKMPADSHTKTQVVTAVNGMSFGQQFISQTEKFVRDNKWVIPYAVYKNLKDAAMQASWKEWPENLRHLSRDQIMLRWNNRALRSSHNFFVWCQMRAAEQFKSSSDYIRSQNIILKGDLPILMNEDSCDAWAWPEFFNHDLRAGSPPDGENPMGQSWGFPTYNWDRLAADNYSWWKDRIAVAANYYSAFRIDHVLGFFRIWAVDQNESTAFLGHTEPYRAFTRKELTELGFDDSRIRWLSQPHVPTQLADDITWNRDESHRALSLVMDRIGNEELWLFKKDITSDKQIYSTQFFANDTDKDSRLKDVLAKKWRDRALIEVTKDHFVRVWSYSDSTAWKSLSNEEQHKLVDIFKENEEKDNNLWKKQATTLLSAITAASDMTACAEDLGAVPAVVPDVLRKLNILSLRVVRWCRDWWASGSPYVPLTEYPEMSVTTTSVHDSPTLRQWWCDEKDSVREYIKLWDSEDENPLFDNTAPVKADEPFSPNVASFCLGSAASSASNWYINPLQDYLYLEQKYYLENKNDERINIPGSVNTFNWTYRSPVTIEELMNNKSIINSIRNIVQIHDTIQIAGGKK